MYAQYAYKAAATQANILSDLIAILTGTTDKTTLSAACDQANSSISTTYAVAGWSLHDNAAATNRKVIRALCADGTTYKHVVIDLNTSNTILFSGAETWNNSTHAGTFYTGSSAAATNISGSFYTPATLAGYIYIHATAAGITLILRNANGYSSAAHLCIEFTRTGKLSDAALSYPCWGIVYNSTQIMLPRMKHPTSTGDGTYSTASGYFMKLETTIGTSLYGSASYKEPSTEVAVYEAVFLSDMPIMLCASPTVYALLGRPITDMFLSSVGASLDEAVVNSKTYIKLNYSNMLATAGASSLWLPKG